MNKYILHILILFAFGFSSTLQAKGKNPKKAKKYSRIAYDYFEMEEYDMAEKFYKKSIEIDSTIFISNLELGILYLTELNKEVKALPYLQRAERFKNTDEYTQELYYYLARAYHYNGFYTEAQLYYKKTMDFVEDNLEGSILKQQVKQYLDECYNGANNEINVKRNYKINNLGKSINTEYPEYVPVLLNGDTNMIFTSRRKPEKGNKKDVYDEKYYEDMFATQKVGEFYVQAERFDSEKQNAYKNLKNSSDHESVVSISPDHQSLITYKDNNLWISEIKGGTWSMPKRLDTTINAGTWQPHGVFSQDGKTLYFSSNMNGGYGGLDIYMSVRFPDGTWSKAKNLGPKINTLMDEDAPFVVDNGNLIYFSSKGRKGLGGYDIYKSKLVDGEWQSAENMGRPFNSPADDVFFTYTKSEKQGFLSSNRQGGEGDMDIYSFKYGVAANFQNCKPFVNNSYSVKLDASASLENIGDKVTLEWDMGNGDKVFGEKIDYTYKEPGNYKVTLNLINTVTNVREEEETKIDIDLSGYTTIYFSIPDTVQANVEQILDASMSKIKNGIVEHHFWSIDDEVLEDIDSAYVKKSFAPGKHKIKLEVTGRDTLAKKDIDFCFAKDIIALIESDYYAYKLRKQQREDAIAGVNQKDNTDIKGTSLSDIKDKLINEDKKKKEYLIDIGSDIDYSKIESDPNAANIKLEPVYFNFDKYNVKSSEKTIIDANIQKLKENPAFVFKISSHADSRGSKKYNYKLSRKRALATVKYLIDHGIDKSRIVALVSQGEDSLTNECGDGVPCPESKHKQNRRSEFAIIGILKK
jgi:outer membrane protein OmpA-like peptidoglycan-associated protein/tetratricopeptide (TPR) repeat protein